jgi:mannose-6-phosphate isomerase-like protein (cupin superfamily)
MSKEIRVTRGFSVDELNKRALENTEEKKYFHLPEQEYGFRVMEVGSTIEPEVHEHETQITGVVQGELAVVVDGMVEIVGVGEHVVIPPRKNHTIYQRGEEETKLWSVYV